MPCEVYVFLALFPHYLSMKFQISLPDSEHKWSFLLPFSSKFLTCSVHEILSILLYNHIYVASDFPSVSGEIVYNSCKDDRYHTAIHHSFLCFNKILWLSALYIANPMRDRISVLHFLSFPRYLTFCSWDWYHHLVSSVYSCFSCRWPYFLSSFSW